MARVSRTASPEVPPAIEYVGGDPSLDLVNTVDWCETGPANERLTSYERLLDWAEGARVLLPNEARALRRRAGERPHEADEALAAARAVRSSLHDLFHQVAGGELSPATEREFDDRLASALARLGIATRESGARPAHGLRWRWRGADERLDSPLWPVVWSAARLLTSRESDRIRVCAGPDCGWTYVDRSRNGFRRWCQMRTCGTAAKSERRRRKNRG